MLEGLHKIDWEGLGYAWIPDWLPNIVSTDETTRHRAYDALTHRSIGDASPASPYLVPLFLEILAAEDIPDREEVLIFLGDTAFDCADLIEQHRWYYGACRMLNELAKGVDLYFALLEENPILFNKALYVLRFLKPNADQIAPRLLKMYDAAAFDHLKQQIVSAMSKLVSGNELIRDNAPYLAVFRKTVESNLSPELRITAAEALLMHLEADAPDIAIQIIDEAFKANQWPVIDLGKALAKKNIDVAIEVTTGALPHITRQEKRLKCVAMLLDLAFSEGNVDTYYMYIVPHPGKPTHFSFSSPNRRGIPADMVSSLNERQKGVVKTIVAFDEIWDYTTDLFDLFGLPDSREALQRLLKD